MRDGVETMRYTEQQLLSACMTYRHDFGLLPASSQDAVRRQMAQILEHMPEAEPASPLDRLPVPGAAVRALVERWRVDGANSVGKADPHTDGDYSRGVGWSAMQCADELESALRADAAEMPSREEVARALRVAWWDSAGDTQWDELAPHDQRDYFRLADVAIELLAGRPAVEMPRFQVTSEEWLRGGHLAHHESFCQLDQLNAVLTGRPAIDEAEAPKHWEVALQDADKRIADLESQLASVTKERDRALQDAERTQIIARSAMDDGGRACKERDEARAKLAEAEHARSFVEADRVTLNAWIDRLAAAAGLPGTALGELEVAVAQLAARPEPVVIDEALANPCATLLPVIKAIDDSRGATPKNRAHILRDKLRVVFGASASVPQGELKATQFTLGDYTICPRERDWCAWETEAAEEGHVAWGALQEVVDYVMDAMVRGDERDQLRAELEKTRAELEACRSECGDHLRCLARAGDDDRLSREAFDRLNERHGVLREQHETLRAGVWAWIGGLGDAMLLPQVDALRALLKPAPAEATVIEQQGPINEVQASAWQHISSASRTHTFRHSSGAERTVEGFDTWQEAAKWLDEPEEPVQHQPPESAMVSVPEYHERMGRETPRLAPIWASLDKLESTLRTFLTDWARGSFNKDRAAEVLEALDARKGGGK